MSEKIEVQNFTSPNHVQRVDKAKYTAMRDAFLAVRIPFIEIHLSNTFAREEFRHNSYFSDIANSCLFGFGAYGYELALQAASQYVADAEG